MKKVTSLHNQNPGNLRSTSQFKWKGEVNYNPPAIASFADLSLGYRALFLDLKAKIKRGLNTARKIFVVYAPKGDGANNPENYAKHVSWMTNRTPDAKLQFSPDYMIPLAAAITYQEHGKAVPTSELFLGWRLATGQDISPSKLRSVPAYKNGWPGFLWTDSPVRDERPPVSAKDPAQQPQVVMTRPAPPVRRDENHAESEDVMGFLKYIFQL